jgi:hypothetical protein
VAVKAALPWERPRTHGDGACSTGRSSLDFVVPIRGIQRAGDPDFDLVLGVPVIRQADWIIDLARGVWGFAG